MSIVILWYLPCIQVYCRVLSGFVALSMLTSCAIIYRDKNLIKQEKTKALLAGKATKEDIYKVIGQPADVISGAPRCCSWVFRYREAKGGML